MMIFHSVDDFRVQQGAVYELAQAVPAPSFGTRRVLLAANAATPVQSAADSTPAAESDAAAQGAPCYVMRGHGARGNTWSGVLAICEGRVVPVGTPGRDGFAGRSAQEEMRTQARQVLLDFTDAEPPSRRQGGLLTALLTALAGLTLFLSAKSFKETRA